MQRPDRQTVEFSSCLRSNLTTGEGGCSQVPIGVDLEGKLQFVDLASPNTPHLLVAGTSGSGKSEWLRTAVAGMILANTPETLRLVLIDPKRTAFHRTQAIALPIWSGRGSSILPEDSALNILEALIEEMEERYQRFSREASATWRNISRKRKIGTPQDRLRLR